MSIPRRPRDITNLFARGGKTGKERDGSRKDSLSAYPSFEVTRAELFTSVVLHRRVAYTSKSNRDSMNGQAGENRHGQPRI